MTKKVSLLYSLIWSSIGLLANSLPAYAQCKQWQDTQGTSHYYCKYGNQIDHSSSFLNGTETRQSCYQFPNQTNCTFYSNGKQVRECTYTQYGTQCGPRTSIDPSITPQIILPPTQPVPPPTQPTTPLENLFLPFTEQRFWFEN